MVIIIDISNSKSLAWPMLYRRDLWGAAETAISRSCTMVRNA